MNMEGYKGIGRASRRAMIRQWKASGKKLSLKVWARQQGVGDAATVWAQAKRSK
jgi:hypothetical protein